MFVQTIGEYADMAASLRRNTIARLLAAGRSPDGMVIAMVAAAAPLHTSRFVADATGGGPVQMVSVPVTLALAEAVERLNAVQPTVLIGYPSRGGTGIRAEGATERPGTARSSYSYGELRRRSADPPGALADRPACCPAPGSATGRRVPGLACVKPADSRIP